MPSAEHGSVPKMLAELRRETGNSPTFGGLEETIESPP
jgi:hypothetical protein